MYILTCYDDQSNLNRVTFCVDIFCKIVYIYAIGRSGSAPFPMGFRLTGVMTRPNPRVVNRWRGGTESQTKQADGFQSKAGSNPVPTSKQS
jgi:hypothetical protein